MSKKSEVLKIWSECFPGDSPRWRRMFFDAVYVDDEALTLADPATGSAVSSLLLLSYSMTFHGSSVGIAYIYGAGTRRKFRACGYMSRLVREALHEASVRGDTFVTLIPATESLRLYYRRFGFSTVFFSRPERYTSAHRFAVSGNYTDLPDNAPGLYEAFERLMSARPCCVQHTRAQFLTLMDDSRLSGNFFAAVGDPADGRPLAMAWAVPELASDVLRVKELLAADPDAANAALTALQRQAPGRPLTLMTRPANSMTGGNFIAGGMARVVNAEQALRAVAEAHPGVHLTVRLTDALLPENSGVYILDGGSVQVTDAVAPGSTANLDITPEVLTAMLFSSTPIADVTGLPACRPCMSLMLD